VDIINTNSPECIYFAFSSSGGNVDAGITIYNFLRSLPVKIVMHNSGSIDSIANVIFHAADAEDRFANPHSTFLFHGCSGEFKGNVSLSPSRIQEVLNQLSAQETKIANILAGRCNLALAELQDLLLREEVKDTDFAISKGIIKSVSQFAIPPNSKFYSLSFT
jgi:ATP-dependent Clp protease, protease subunit